MEDAGMNPYDGPERRDPGPILAAIADMRVDLADRLGRIEEAAKGHEARLTNHSERIEAIVERTTSLEHSRTYIKGGMAVIGVPTFGTLAWLVYEFGAALKKLKGGG